MATRARSFDGVPSCWNRTKTWASERRAYIETDRPNTHPGNTVMGTDMGWEPEEERWEGEGESDRERQRRGKAKKRRNDKKQ